MNKTVREHIVSLQLVNKYIITLAVLTQREWQRQVCLLSILLTRSRPCDSRSADRNVLFPKIVFIVCVDYYVFFSTFAMPLGTAAPNPRGLVSLVNAFGGLMTFAGDFFRGITAVGRAFEGLFVIFVLGAGMFRMVLGRR